MIANPSPGDFHDVIAVANVMADAPVSWWFVGGWAIDLFLGRVTREHSDLEIGIFRHDQHVLRQHLASWIFSRCADRQWLDWANDYTIALPDFQLRLKHENTEPREFEIFLDDLDPTNERWICRRHPDITLPRDGFTIENLLAGRTVRSLRPEIQLFYKAKYHRPKDERDFDAVLPSLAADGRKWLSEALAQCYGNDPWRRRV